MGKCQWRGYRGKGMSCIQGCGDGETEVVTDTSVQDGKKPPPSKSQLEKQAADAAKDAAEAAAEQAALDIAAKAFCRVAVPALLAPLELAEDLIPIIGEILDIAEIAATPALIQGCVKGIEKEGKAEFKVFGKKHSLSLDKSSTLPQTRAPSSSHKPESTSSACNKRAPNCKRTTTATSARQPIHTERPNDFGYNPLTCPTKSSANYRQGGRGEQITVDWADQHNDAWWHGYMQQPNLNCERDEYPPAVLWQNQPIHEQYIRMVPRAQNGAAGPALFNMAFCKFDGQGNPPVSTRNVQFDRIVHGPDRDTSLFTADVTTTLATLSIQFPGYPNQPDDGLTANPCWPSTLVNDPGFALLTDDPWYIVHPGNAQRHQTAMALYGAPPPLAYTQNNPPRPGYQKRSLGLMNVDLILDEGNSTTKLTGDDFDKLRYHDCKDADCLERLKQVKLLPGALLPSSISSAPKPCDAEPTAVGNGGPPTSSTAPMVGGGVQGALDSIPKPTGKADKP
ncbi:MAG: hypothetical protein Q9170_005310 [Blastenia crenularia]